MANKNTTFRMGDEGEFCGDAHVDCSNMNFFDELEYSCWDLICEYAEAFGLEVKSDIDFYSAKEVQEAIIKLFKEAGVEFKF